MKQPHRTTMLLNPSLEECVAAAVARAMPEAEGRKFFYHYESNGWKVGKLPMKSFAGAMGGWYERWLERGGNSHNGGNGAKHHPPGSSNGAPLAMSGAVMMVKQKEYERVIERLKKLKDGFWEDYPGEKQKLRTRRDALRKDLGLVI